MANQKTSADPGRCLDHPHDLEVGSGKNVVLAESSKLFVVFFQYSITLLQPMRKLCEEITSPASSSSLHVFMIVII